jgi:hypothetical protein
MGSLPSYVSRVNMMSPSPLVCSTGSGVGIDSSSIGGESQAGDAATESTGVAGGGVSSGDTAAVEWEPPVASAVAKASIDWGVELAVASGDAVSSGGATGLLVALAAGVVVLASAGVSVGVSDGFAAAGVSVELAATVTAGQSSADSASLTATSCSRSRSQAASNMPASASVKRDSNSRRIFRYFRSHDKRKRRSKSSEIGSAKLSARS